MLVFPVVGGSTTEQIHVVAKRLAKRYHSLLAADLETFGSRDAQARFELRLRPGLRDCLRAGRLNILAQPPPETRGEVNGVRRKK